MADFSIKAGTRAPDLAATLTRDGAAVDLSSAQSVTLRMTHLRTGRAVTGAMAVATASEGFVTFAWQEGDTDERGPYRVDVLVDWDGAGETEAFPTGGFATMEVL